MKEYFWPTAIAVVIALSYICVYLGLRSINYTGSDAAGHFVYLSSDNRWGRFFGPLIWIDIKVTGIEYRIGDDRNENKNHPYCPY